jgi:hypothetical protein
MGENKRVDHFRQTTFDKIRSLALILTWLTAWLTASQAVLASEVHSSGLLRLECGEAELTAKLITDSETFRPLLEVFSGSRMSFRIRIQKISQEDLLALSDQFVNLRVQIIRGGVDHEILARALTPPRLTVAPLAHTPQIQILSRSPCPR